MSCACIIMTSVDEKRSNQSTRLHLPIVLVLPGIMNEGKAAHLKSVVHKECKDVNLDSG
jgi:hypothetical protein